MIRQAVILAAGRGKRMLMSGGPAGTPKPLIELDGAPIIERMIKKLEERKVEIAVVINPADKGIFERKLGGHEIEYVFQSKPLGTANAVYCAKKFVTEELFLVMMGDDITEYDPSELLNIREPTVFGFSVDDVSGYGAVITDDNEEVADIVEKEKTGKGIANAGVYVLPREFFDIYKEIPKDRASGEYFLTCAPKIMRRQGVRFRLRKMAYWFGINTKEQLEEAEKKAKKGKKG